MDLAALLTLVAIVTGPRTALTTGRHRSPIEDGGTGLSVPALSLTPKFSEVVRDRLEAARCKPTCGLLINGFSGRQVMR
ncbi:protein of unknown function [Methylocaldum szegediense]|uniref:Secreted protein n=1 Tax=Methylocaldum szegediense TaxID=73780 RepID=A0ABM9HWL7_9GAMM|nr:protein of unknown function [Methylocaldum szegediense]